jgi:CBS domain-containing protein
MPGRSPGEEPPTCALDDRIADVRATVLEAGRNVCIVVSPEGVVQGRLRARALAETPEATAEQAMELGPTTIRPSERLEPLVQRMRRRGVATIVVSDLKGGWWGSCTARTPSARWRPLDDDLSWTGGGAAGGQAPPG